MKEINNEKFLTINEIIDIAKRDCSILSKILPKYFYLNGPIECIYESIDQFKGVNNIIKSLFRRGLHNVNYEKGEYELNVKDLVWDYYLEGLFTNCSYGSISNNEFIMAFHPSEYSIVKEGYYVKGYKNVFIPNTSQGFFNVLEKNREGIASISMRMKIVEDIKKMDLGNYSKLEKRKLVEDYCQEENVWFDENHFTKCLVEQLLSPSTDLQDPAFTTYYRLSDVKTYMEKDGIDFNLTSKTEEINSNAKTLIKNGKTDAKNLISLLLKVKPPNNPLLHYMLTEYIDNTGAKSAPEFNELLYYIIQNNIDIPLTSKINYDKIILANKRIVKTQNLARAYNRQKIKTKTLVNSKFTN